MAIEWKDRHRGITPVDAWTYREDLGNGWEIYADIDPCWDRISWTVIWRLDQTTPDSPTGVHVELRVEGMTDAAEQAKTEATQAIGRLQTMATADPQMLIRLQTTTGGV